MVVLAVIVFAIACRTFASRWLHKLGAIAILAASYLAAYFVFPAIERLFGLQPDPLRSHIAGTCAMLGWFFIPWIELLTRVRSLRLPLNKKLHHKSPPSRDRFPTLNEFTDEIETEGYEYVDDAGW